MGASTDFVLVGTYRVQSRGLGRASRLAGTWLGDDRRSESVNDVLGADPDWWSGDVVRIRGASTTDRQGEFADEPDILYKRSHFVADEASDLMDFDIVDANKAASQWIERAPCTAKVFGSESYDTICQMVGDVGAVSVDEYFAHEYGHCLGYSTSAKYLDGYFRVDGRTLWPLVYVEELRADLLSFEFAATQYPPAVAAAIFLYNLSLRFGSHAQGLARSDKAPYGPLPLLLFAVLRECGAVRAVGDVIQFKDGLSYQTAQTVMMELGALARARLIENRQEDATDAALRAAAFYRSVMEQTDTIEDFNSVFTQQPVHPSVAASEG